jgi:hypothetical protein
LTGVIGAAGQAAPHYGDRPDLHGTAMKHAFEQSADGLPITAAAAAAQHRVLLQESAKCATLTSR